MCLLDKLISGLRNGGGILAILVAFPAIGNAGEPMIAGTLPEDYLPGLKELLATSLKQSPQMIVGELSVAVADAQRISSGLSPMLPSVNGAVSYAVNQESVSGNSASSNSSSGLFYNVGLNQNLFAWKALKNQLEIQKIAEKIAENNYAEGYRQLASTLRKQYLSLIVAKMNLVNARFSLELSRKALETAQKKLKAGAIAPGDTIGPEMDVEDRALSADRMAQGYDFARRTLAHEAGLSDIADAEIPTAIPAPAYSADTASALLAELLRSGAKNTFQAQVDLLNIRQNDLNYRIARVHLFPKFSLSAGLSLQNQSYATPTSVYQTGIFSYTYSVGASWTLFDGLATRYIKLQALESKRISERQLQTYTESTMDQAQNGERTVAFAWRALALAQRRHDLAEAGLKHVEEEHKRGNASQDSVDGVMDQFNYANSSTAAARADFLGSWSDFVSLVGADPAMNNLPARYVRQIH